MRKTTKITEFSQEERRSLILEKIENAGSQFMTIFFVKKDGTRRSMTIQQAAMAPLLKGEEASDSAKKAVQTRKKNNPNLVAVYDTQKKEIRSVNLDTTYMIEVGKETLEFSE